MSVDIDGLLKMREDRWEAWQKARSIPPDADLGVSVKAFRRSSDAAFKYIKAVRSSSEALLDECVRLRKALEQATQRMRFDPNFPEDIVLVTSGDQINVGDVKEEPELASWIRSRTGEGAK